MRFGSDFEYWWYHEGSGPRLPGEDSEEHCRRMCKIAWSNGADKEREVDVKILQDFQERTGLDQSGCIEAIRKGEHQCTSLTSAAPTAS